jgi:hypothetical protein
VFRSPITLKFKRTWIAMTARQPSRYLELKNNGRPNEGDCRAKAARSAIAYGPKTLPDFCAEPDRVGAFGSQQREVCETLLVNHKKGYRGDL